MDMTGERRIPAPQQRVWTALNDTETLKRCIPGCESLERTSENEMKATASVKIGPIGARFTGKVQLTDLDPPNSYRISGEGQGGVAGFAKGGANVHLSEDGAFTLLKYDVKAQVGGKIAQLGARLIDATAKQMADAFFDRFTSEVSAPSSVGADGLVGVAAALTGDADSVSRPASAPVTSHPAHAPQPPMPAKLNIWDMIPKEPFGYPRVAVIGTIIWLAIFVLIFKGYVLG